MINNNPRGWRIIYYLKTKMTDIYDIKWLLLWDYMNLTFSLIFIVIFIISYFLLFYRKKETKVEQKIIVEPIKHKEIDYDKLVNELENNILNYNEEVFYHKIDKILRLYIFQKWYKNIESLTLEELNKLNLDNIFINLFKNIYFKEYAENIKDNLELRKEYLQRIKDLVLNK